MQGYSKFEQSRYDMIFALIMKEWKVGMEHLYGNPMRTVPPQITNQCVHQKLNLAEIIHGRLDNVAFPVLLFGSVMLGPPST
jgi:hypothetical protein